MDTKTKIITAAETLFANKGFVQTSMREITTSADVNLAAVNYHFGNKKNLIQAVFRRYFDCFMPSLDENLDRLDKDVSVLQVLASCEKPLTALDGIRHQGCCLFLLLLGRGYNETQGHLRRFIQEQYGSTLDKLMFRLQKAVPWISAETLFWRLHFALGALVFTMAAQTALSEIAQADFQHSTTSNDMLKQLIPFIAHGIGAK